MPTAFFKLGDSEIWGAVRWKTVYHPILNHRTLCFLSPGLSYVWGESSSGLKHVPIFLASFLNYMKSHENIVNVLDLQGDIYKT